MTQFERRAIIDVIVLGRGGSVEDYLRREMDLPDQTNRAIVEIGEPQVSDG